MKYITRLTARQVILAFELYIKRLRVLASKNPSLWSNLRKAGHRPLTTPATLAP